MRLRSRAVLVGKHRAPSTPHPCHAQVHSCFPMGGDSPLSHVERAISWHRLLRCVCTLGGWTRGRVLGGKGWPPSESQGCRVPYPPTTILLHVDGKRVPTTSRLWRDIVNVLGLCPRIPRPGTHDAPWCEPRALRPGIVGEPARMTGERLKLAHQRARKKLPSGGLCAPVPPPPPTPPCGDACRMNTRTGGDE